jgi:Beta-lactamase enzyme family
VRARAIPAFGLAVVLLGAPAAPVAGARAPAAHERSTRAFAGGPRATPRPWNPDVRAALAYLRHRRGDVAFAVRTPARFWAHRPYATMHSASVIKAMLMVAYLNRRSVRGRTLKRGDHRLLQPMITRSDNAAATAVRNIVGNDALRGLARRVGMRRFRVDPVWGLSRICAADQTRFFLHIDRWVPPRHRRTVLDLLSSVIPAQRWGIARARPPGWRLYFKGGWGVGTGRVDHQIALLRRGPLRVSIAILTRFDGNQAYGNETLRGLAARLLRGLEGPVQGDVAVALRIASGPGGGA